MTDNEIIQALECCCSPRVNACDDCPFHKRCYENNEWLEKEAIDLIKRQQAEIERLNGLLAEWKAEAYKLSDSIGNIKSETVKEVTRRLESTMLKQLATATEEKKEVIRFCLDEIDNIEKEMVGEAE